jgi:2-keto-4-pentenoate hydratase/2-oxohepta-3-ene-1,7-dioic acid hydratase in catechol pathway
MKLANIQVNGRPRVALIDNGEALDLTTYLGDNVDDLPAFFANGEEARTLTDRAVQRATSRIPLHAVRLLPPIRRADKILGVGMNYHSFVRAATEHGVPLPKQLVWFLRPRACISGPYDEIWLPKGAQDLDYEAELAVIIGRHCRHVTAAQAREVIAGYTVSNDFTLRERVLQSVPLGKSFDTHLPVGPWIVTADELPDPHDLEIRTWVNGELRQNSTTADMIASCYELIERASAICTLNPGDVLITGTPTGSGIFCNPPRSLQVGDVIKVEIEGIGAIENRVIDEPPIDA